MLTRSGHLHRALRTREEAIMTLTNQLLDRESGWGILEQTDTGIPDDRDSLVAKITALESELQEVKSADR